MRAAEAPPDPLEVGSRARRRRARSDEQLCGLVVTRAIGFSCFEAVLRLPGVLAGGVSRPKQLRGLQVAHARKPAPAISPEREWRAIEQRRAVRVPHDLHALSWVIAFHRAVGKLGTDNWRTPSYVTGRYPVPRSDPDIDGIRSASTRSHCPMARRSSTSSSLRPGQSNRTSRSR
jgi:hypothetical protein